MIFLDTHVVVWLYAGHVKKLSKAVIEQVENNELCISQVVRLELQYLFEIGRLTVTPEIIIKNLSQSIGLKVSDMQVEQVFDQAIEYGWTRDVFDRLITAEAEATESVLITKDQKIQANYAKAFW
ncbi:MAG: PIN domain-containing protein [Methyloprofundus sp.]|nr:PIN domain-containing protein [Methyloprofundus sp.]